MQKMSKNPSARFFTKNHWVNFKQKIRIVLCTDRLEKFCFGPILGSFWSTNFKTNFFMYSFMIKNNPFSKYFLNKVSFSKKTPKNKQTRNLTLKPQWRWLKVFPFHKVLNTIIMLRHGTITRTGITFNM